MTLVGWQRRFSRYVALDDEWSWRLTVAQNHERYMRKTIGLTSGAVTMEEIMTGYERGAGKPLGSIPSVIANSLLKWNSASQGL